jgi:hypothetical protein
MVTSESGAPAGGSGAARPVPAAPSDEDNDLQDIATFLVTTFVENATRAAVDLLQQTAKAFEESLNTALAGEFTVGTLAKDSAALWARNVQSLLRVFSVDVPTGATTTVNDEDPTGLPVEHPRGS